MFFTTFSSWKSACWSILGSSWYWTVYSVCQWDTNRDDI